GGEWGGSVLLALEYGHRGRRGFYASWPQAGVPLGLLTSTGGMALIQSLASPKAFFYWGWRIPFLLSGPLIAVGFIIPIPIMATALFDSLKEREEIARAPVTETFRNHWREVLLAGGSRISENACFYLFSAYVLTYGDKVLKLDKSTLLWGVNLAAAMEFITI